jgi:hypothetical protein
VGLGATHAYTPPRENLSCHLLSGWPKILVACEMLAHSLVVFHPCTCGLHVGTTALNGYDDVEVAAGTTTRRRRLWSTTFSTPMRYCVGSLLQLFFRCTARLVVTIHYFLLTSFLGWHDRYNASVAYSFLYIGTRAVLGRFMWWIYCCTTWLDQSELKLIASCDWMISSHSMSIMCAICLY